MAAITQTIAIFDQSNKVVSTSKQLKNVFKEAKMAYLERKAEIVEARRAKEDRELQKAMKSMTLVEDTKSDTSQRSRRHRSHRKESEPAQERPALDGHCHSSESRRRIHARVESEADVSRHPHEPRARHVGLAEFNDELYDHPRSAPTSPHVPPGGHELVRRITDLPLQTQRRHRPPPVRSHSASDIDMDLAYGDFHPESLMLHPQTEQKLQKQEMSSLVLKCKMLMEEANCAQHSVRAIIAHLQQNPDAMAAVALTLAEISNLASKMAPGALAAFKAGAPGVFAMLAAPEFLIAVGVGVGITVVMFGGYKIIKKIKARVSDKEDDGAMEEMLDVKDLDRIDHWRRGIPDAETASIATSVEGEFITPMAARSMGHLPIPKTRSEDGSKGHRKEEKKRRHRRLIEADPDATVVGSESSSKSRRNKSSQSEKKAEVVTKVKKPSTLRKMFSSKDSAVSSRR
jgi:hypothetical protein